MRKLISVLALPLIVFSIIVPSATPAQAQPTSFCYNWNTNLRIGDSGQDVGSLQRALVQEGFIIGKSNFAADSYFDEQTASGVVQLQEKYASEVLTPNGLVRGTGYVGASTRAKLNALYGCSGTVPTNPTPGTGSTIVCYSWTRDLTIGSSGPDVVALQTRLIAMGFDIPAITQERAPKGYFGPATAAALRRFQASVSLQLTGEALGYFGPQTRAVLSKGACSTTSTVEWVFVSGNIITSPALPSISSSSLTASLVLKAKAVGGKMAKPVASDFEVVFAPTDVSFSPIEPSSKTVTVSPNTATINEGETYTVTITGVLYSDNPGFCGTHAMYMGLLKISSRPGGEGMIDEALRMRTDSSSLSRSGACPTTPTVCTTIYQPVCGSNGQTYSNACVARGAGVTNYTEGACSTSTTIPVKIVDSSTHDGSNGIFVRLSIKGYETNKQVHHWVLGYNCPTGVVLDTGKNRLCDGVSQGKSGLMYYAYNMYDATSDYLMITAGAENKNTTPTQLSFSLDARDANDRSIGTPDYKTFVLNPIATPSNPSIYSLNLTGFTDGRSVVAGKELVLGYNIAPTGKYDTQHILIPAAGTPRKSTGTGSDYSSVWGGYDLGGYSPNNEISGWGTRIMIPSDIPAGTYHMTVYLMSYGSGIYGSNAKVSSLASASSDSFTVISSGVSAQPSITVTSPNGNVWQSGTNQTISWKDDFYTSGAYYTIFATRRDGGAYGIIANQVYGTSYTWNVGTLYDGRLAPLASGESSYHIQIVRQTLPHASSSDSPFTISNSGGTTQPSINFTASPTTINSGGSTVLSWSGTNISSCSLSGPVSASYLSSTGTKTVSLTGTGTFTITCTGPTGVPVTKSVMVTVNPVITPAYIPAPTIYSFGSSQSTVSSGAPVTVAWNVVDASRCIIQYGASEISIPASSGTKVFYPTQTTSYRLWCVNDPSTDKGAPSSERTLTVTVNAPVSTAQSSITLIASPTTINPGQTTTLSWTGTNVTSCNLSGPTSASYLSSSGTKTVTMIGTDTFHITCTGSNGIPVTKSVTINVNPVQTNSSSASSITVISPNGGETLTEGSTVTIRWSAAGVSASDYIHIMLTDASGADVGYLNWWMPGTATEYAWKVGTGIGGAAFSPALAGNRQYKVKVYTSSGSMSDLSDSTFLVAAPTSSVQGTPNTASVLDTVNDFFGKYFGW